jgi:hypothetical protein
MEDLDYRIKVYLEKKLDYRIKVYLNKKQLPPYEAPPSYEFPPSYHDYKLNNKT